MTADTNSTLLQLLLQATGNNNNSWGDSANTFVFTRLENAIAGMTTISGLTGGSHTLTDDEARCGIILLTGTLTADQTIQCSNRTKIWRIFNNTSGSFYMLFKTASGTAVNIPKGKVVDVFCDGADGVYRSDRHMVGTMFFHGGTTAPAGALECNGATPLRASAVDLFAAISTTWGVGNGSTTFTIPDTYTAGRYMRSRSASLAIATVQADDVKPHSHSASFSSGVADSQGGHVHSGTTGSQNANHTHAYGLTFSSLVGIVAGSGGVFNLSAGGASSTANTQIESGNHQHDYSNMGTAGAHTHTVTGTVTVSNSTGTETRPVSLVGMYCIWY